jgi:hypothetical protein
MRDISHNDLKFFFAIGRVTTLMSPHVSKIHSSNAKIFSTHNSRLLWLVNHSNAIRRKVAATILQKQKETAEHQSSFFVIKLKSRCAPPNLIAYSADGAKLPMAIGESGLRGLDSAGLINSGYWVPGEAFVDWIWPSKSKKLHFLYTSSDREENGTSLCKRAWVTRGSILKTAHAISKSHHLGVSIYPGGLLFNQSSIIDIDPSQNSETYRRGIFIQKDSVVRFRRLQTKTIEVPQGSFIGSNLDFLYFESLAYGLPKLLHFFENNPEPRDSAQILIMNSYTHPATLSLFDSILSERRYEPIIRPSSDSTLLIANLDIYHSQPDWVGNLVKFKNTINGIVSLHGNSRFSRNFPRKVFLVRGLGARGLRNRVPENIETLVNIASEFGYQTVDPGSLTLPEQMQLFKNVEFIISPHGGGLVNLIWAERSPAVLEIFSGWNDSCFKDLASGFSLNYEAFYCDVNQIHEEIGNGNFKHAVGDEKLFRLAIQRQLAKTHKDKL